MTIRDFCEQHRPNDDLESLYFVLWCQFGVKPEQELGREVEAILESLDKPPLPYFCMNCKTPLAADQIERHACPIEQMSTRLVDADFSDV